MTIYRGRPFSPVESQMDLMKSHTIRPVNRPERTEGGRTLQLAVPAGWTAKAKCIPAKPNPKVKDFIAVDKAVGLKETEAAARCAGCPVIEQCLSEAMEEESGLSAGYRYTVRGGLSPKERADLATAQRECERGHTGRWGSNPKSSVPTCLECSAEDFRASHARRLEEDPSYRNRIIERQRKWREQRRVSCLECRAEMVSSHLGTHVTKQHGEREAA